MLIARNFKLGDTDEETDLLWGPVGTVWHVEATINFRLIANGPRSWGYSIDRNRTIRWNRNLRRLWRQTPLDLLSNSSARSRSPMPSLKMKVIACQVPHLAIFHNAYSQSIASVNHSPFVEMKNAIARINHFGMNADYWNDRIKTTRFFTCIQMTGNRVRSALLS